MTADVPVQFIVAAKAAGWQSVAQFIAVPIIATGATLLGVWFTNVQNDKRAKRESAERLGERKLEHDRRDVLEGRERSMSALRLAIQIEDFAVQCAEVVASQSVAKWKGNEQDFDVWPVKAVWLRPIPG